MPRAHAQRHHRLRITPLWIKIGAYGARQLHKGKNRQAGRAGDEQGRRSRLDRLRSTRPTARWGFLSTPYSRLSASIIDACVRNPAEFRVRFPSSARVRMSFVAEMRRQVPSMPTSAFSPNFQAMTRDSVNGYFFFLLVKFIGVASIVCFVVGFARYSSEIMVPHFIVNADLHDQYFWFYCALLRLLASLRGLWVWFQNPVRNPCSPFDH